MKIKILLSILLLIFVFTGCNSDTSDQNSTDTNSTDNNSDNSSGTDSDSNVIIYYDSDSNIISGTDSGSIITLQPLRIEAECAFGADKGDCDGKVDGTNSNLPGQDGADSIPLLKEGELVVGYFYAGSWLAFPDIDLTGYTTVTASVASSQTGGSFEIRLDAPDGELVATIEVPNTGSWETFESAEADLSSVTGIHTVYLVSSDNGTYNGDVDWIEFSADSTADSDTVADTGADTDIPWDTDNSNFTNPVIWEDLADCEVIRVDDTFYYTASTMHYSPGAPVLRSYDLVNWEYAGHSVPSLDWGNKYNMDGDNAYVNGIWASTLQYRPDNKTFYWLGCVDFLKTYVYTATSIDGPWEAHSTINNCYYDAGLFIDDDNKMYVAYGNSKIYVAELSSDGKSQVGTPQMVYDSGNVTLEGSRFFKHEGSYYILLTRPPNAEFVLRSTNGPLGPYTIQTLVDNVSSPIQGGGAPHQGGFVNTSKGDWYYMAFVDAYPGGRMPVLAPVTWANGWPSVQLVNGGWGSSYPHPDVPAHHVVRSSVGTDTFTGTALRPEWEWNHNPVNTSWSLNNGLVLKTATVTNDIYSARNTLTRRIRGPKSTATIKMDISQMADGDRAGLAVFRQTSAWVGVKRTGGSNSVVMTNGLTMDNNWNTTSTGTEVESVSVSGSQIWLRATADIQTGSGRQANFSYSTDGKTFTTIGNNLTLNNEWQFFMGYRFAIFNFTTTSTGGLVKVESFEETTP